MNFSRQDYDKRNSIMLHTGDRGVATEDNETKKDEDNVKKESFDMRQETEELPLENPILANRRSEPLHFDEVLPIVSDSGESDSEEQKGDRAFQRTNTVNLRNSIQRLVTKPKVLSKKGREKKNSRLIFTKPKKTNTIFNTDKKSSLISLPESSMNSLQFSTAHDSNISFASDNVDDSGIFTQAMLGNAYANDADLLDVNPKKTQTFKAEKISSAIFKRKLVRTFSFICFASIIILTFTLVSYFIRVREVREYTADNDYLISVKDCMLEILNGNHTDNPRPPQDVVFELKALMPSRDEYSWHHDAHKKLVNITVRRKNSTGAGGCNLKMWVLPNKTINSLTVKCSGQCIVLQNSTTLKIAGGLSVTGIKNSYGNFVQFEAESFNFVTPQGHVQLNHVTLRKNSVISLGKGDVIVQSATSFEARFNISNSSYCLSAPVQPQPIFDDNATCHASKSITQDKFGKLGQQYCSGSAKMCLGHACNIHFTLNVSILVGSFYANVMEPKSTH